MKALLSVNCLLIISAHHFCTLYVQITFKNSASKYFLMIPYRKQVDVARNKQNTNMVHYFFPHRLNTQTCCTQTCRNNKFYFRGFNDCVFHYSEQYTFSVHDFSIPWLSLSRLQFQTIQVNMNEPIDSFNVCVDWFWIK